MMKWEMNAKAWLNSSPVHLSTILSVISHLRICRSLHRLTTTCFLKIDVVLFNKPHHRCCLYSLYIDRRKLGTVTVLGCAVSVGKRLNWISSGSTLRTMMNP
ncbi:hypothetical protein GQ457_12G007750 [Hibiscus cannabinus]